MPALPIRQDLSAAELRHLARKEADARVSRRLLAIAMALEGLSRAAAARQAGMDPRITSGDQTLRDWVVRYNAQGIAGLHDRDKPGRPPLLAPELEPELVGRIEAGPEFERDGVIAWRVKHICALSRQHFGADYTRSGMQGRLHRMRLSWLKPRPIHPKTNLEVQEGFKKKTSSRSWPRSAKTSPKLPISKSGSRTRRGLARRGP